MSSQLRLLPFQERGVQHLITPMHLDKKLANKLGVETELPHKCLLDEPGLGKTPTTCVALKRVNAKSALIVCPAPEPIKNSWRKHLIEWSEIDEEKIYVVKTGKDAIPTSARFIIVNFELLQKKNIVRQIHHGHRFDAVIIDEVQYLKWTNSKRTGTILGGGDSSLISRGYYKWALSGAGYDRPVELFPILSTLAPNTIFPNTDYDSYGEHFCGGVRDLQGVYRGSSNTKELRTRMRETGFALRREMDDVYKHIPPIIENTVYVDIGDLPSFADESNTQLSTLRKELGIAKVPYIIEYIDYLVKKPEVNKLLVYTWHREVTEGIVAALPKLATAYYGGMSNGQKSTSIEVFKNHPGKSVIVVQRNSGGVGLDGLQQACNHILDAEEDWSGGLDDQNGGRLRRIGQNKTVFRTRLVAEKTLEEKIARVRQHKQWTMETIYDNLKDDHYDQNSCGDDDKLKNEGVNMSIEQSLESIADSLKKLVSGEFTQKVTAVSPKSDADTKPAKDTQPEEKKAATGKKAKAPEHSADEVREAAKGALVRLQENSGLTKAEATAAVKKVCQEKGGETVKDLAEKHYDAAWEEYEAMGLESEDAV